MIYMPFLKNVYIYARMFCSRAQFVQSSRHLFNRTKSGNIVSLALKVEKRVQCVTWYFQTKFITTVRRNFHSHYRKTAPDRTKILKWVEKFSSHGNVKLKLVAGGLQWLRGQFEQSVLTSACTQESHWGKQSPTDGFAALRYKNSEIPYYHVYI